MNNNDISNEKASKKKIAIDDFSFLSKPGIIGNYNECELSHIFILNKVESIYIHYYAICNFEEFEEPDLQLKDIHITNNLIEINKNYSLGIIQKRISLNECKDIFDQLCSGSFNLRNDVVLIPQAMQLLPKVHIPKYWDGMNVLLQNVLKPNFWGDNYIIEFLSIDNPFLNIFTTKEFDEINLRIKELLFIDLTSVNDRIGSFIFQFPITIVYAECNIISDWCKAKLSLNIFSNSISQSDICTIVNTKHDDVVTGFHAIEGIVENYEFNIGDSNNFEFMVINKKDNIIYKHFLGNYIRQIVIGGSFNIQYAEPRTIAFKNNNNVEIEIYNHNLIMVGNDKEFDNRIQQRIYFNSIIKQSGDFQAFDMGQRTEALDYIRKKINTHSGASSEIWLWDPFLRCEDIFNTLYYTKKKEIIMKCITSYKKIKRLKKTYGENFNNFEAFKKEERMYFSYSNNLGINLEFRSTHDQIGTDFHDRFICFIPEDNSKFPIVYSLGTSINSIGTGHHIIQRTLDPKKLENSFLKLWYNLSLDSESLIIKLP